MNRDIASNLVPGTTVFDKEKKYWLKRFAGDLVKSHFPYDFIHQDPLGFTSETIAFTISDELFTRLNHLTNGSNTNLFVVLVSGLTVLLSKYTGNTDIVIGCPILEQEEEGKFLNTLITLRNRLSPTMTFKELLVQIKQTVNEANENSDYPIERLLYYLGLPMVKNGSPLFETILLLQNIHNKKYIEGMGHNMVFQFRMTGQSIEGILEYNAALYRKETIEKLASHLVNVLQNSLKDLDIPISDIEALVEMERHQILEVFNDSGTHMPFPEVKDKALHQLFEEQVEQTPGTTAVVVENDRIFGLTALTYDQLNRKSNQLARFLRKKGVGTDSIVGIMVTPSLDMVIGIMAILKAGGAYLPIDHESPRDRIQYLLKECHCSILLVQDFLKGTVNFQGETIIIDDVELYTDEDSNLENLTDLRDLFYTIYTSGTTGRPKGVLLTNRNLLNYAAWFSKAAGLNDKDKTVLTASFAFDLGYTTFLSSLLTGGELHLLSKGTYINAETLLDYLKANCISYLKMTPSLFSLVVNAPGFSMDTCSTLRLIVLGGEEINTQDVEKAHHICRHIEIMNHYGPTEAAIGCVARFIDFNHFEEYKKHPTIGKPIHNSAVYILDQYFRLLPIGIPGELLISGNGIARGYLNQPELTAHRFISTPVSSRNRFPAARSKMYKTGDLARWIPCGNIEFLGRKDNQVKIRGYRIELAEIENQMLKHEDIRDVVVVPKEDRGTGKYLCAYVVPGAAEGSSDVHKLREFLSVNLPDFMIPPYFVMIEKIPLTPNGKVDRNALPSPEYKKVEKFTAPRDNVEKKLVELWVDILHIERESISIDSNFFDLGGHSLNAAVLISQLHKTFDVKVPMVKVFEINTIREFAKYLRTTAKETFVSIQPVEKRTYYPLSSAQSRLYVLQQVKLDSTAYNVPMIVQLEGIVEREKLEVTFNKLIDMHESFRTSFEIIKGKPAQRVHDHVEFKIKYHDLSMRHDSPQRMKKIIQGFINPFNLSCAPLLRVELIKLEPQKHVLMVDMHHIITDGFSRNILTNQLVELYSGQQPPKLRLQYKDYSQWQYSKEQREKIMKQEAFWVKELEGEIPVLTIPTDFERPAEQVFEGSRLDFELGREETQALKEITAEEDATMYIVLLAIYNIFLSKISGQDDIIVGTSTSGRHHADLDKIVGMFVNTLALRNYPKGDKTFRDFVKDVKERTIMAFSNQEYQFEDLVEKVVKTKNKNRNPLFDVRFTFDNIDQPTKEPVLKVKPLEYENPTAKFDLTLAAGGSGDRLIFQFEYITRLFKEETIKRFVEYFRQILSIAIKTRDIKLKDIRISHDFLTVESKTKQIDLEF